MSRVAIWGALCLLWTGCGEAGGGFGLSGHVRVQGLTKAEVSSLEGFVFDPRLSNETTILTCLSLAAGDVDPRGSEVITLASALASVNQDEDVDLVFGAVPDGGDRVVYIESFDPQAVLNGRGCEEGVGTPGGESTRIELVVQGL